MVGVVTKKQFFYSSMGLSTYKNAKMFLNYDKVVRFGDFGLHGIPLLFVYPEGPIPLNEGVYTLNHYESVQAANIAGPADRPGGALGL